MRWISPLGKIKLHSTGINGGVAGRLVFIQFNFLHSLKCVMQNVASEICNMGTNMCCKILLREKQANFLSWWVEGGEGTNTGDFWNSNAGIMKLRLHSCSCDSDNENVRYCWTSLFCSFFRKTLSRSSIFCWVFCLVASFLFSVDIFRRPQRSELVMDTKQQQHFQKG